MNNLQVAIEFFNSKRSKTKVTRDEYIDHVRWNASGKDHTFDNYRLYLTKAGYLSKTKDVGVYQVNKKIPNSLSLKELYKKSYG